MPRLFLALTLLRQVGAGLMVLLWFWTRLAALALLGFMVFATMLAYRATGLSGALRANERDKRG